jgi:hypothetical protein
MDNVVDGELEALRTIYFLLATIDSSRNHIQALPWYAVVVH